MESYSKKNVITVVAICKRDIFMQCLQEMLKPYAIEILSICTDSVAGIEAYKKYKPDVVIIDAHWHSYTNPFSTVTLIRVLKDENSTCRIIVTTAMPEPGTARLLEAEGANGYFYKNDDKVIKVATDCVRLVAAGNSCFF